MIVTQWIFKHFFSLSFFFKIWPHLSWNLSISWWSAATSPCSWHQVSSKAIRKKLSFKLYHAGSLCLMIRLYCLSVRFCSHTACLYTTHVIARYFLPAIFWVLVILIANKHHVYIGCKIVGIGEKWVLINSVLPAQF